MDPRVLLNPKAALKEQAKKGRANGHDSPSRDTYLTSRSKVRTPSPQRFAGQRQPPDQTSPSSARAFDPKLLLNPKGSGTTSNRSLAREDTDPAASEMNGDTATTKRHSDREDSGPRSMLERLHGVERRVDQPRKKVKIDKTEEDDKLKPKSAYVHKSNGIVGEYMKPDPAAPTVANTLIDLTNAEEDDDDDIQVTGTRNVKDEEEVCYGMITATVQCHVVPKPKDSAVQFVQPTQYPPIKCTLRRTPLKDSRDTIIEVVDPWNVSFGRVNRDVASILAPVMDNLQGFRTQAKIPNRHKTIWQPHEACSEHISIYVTVYGKRGDAHRVGKVFGQGNLWLRAPLMPDKNVPIENPHANRRGPTLQSKPSGRGNVVSETRTVEEATEAVSRLFDHFASSAPDLEETDPPATILTPLLGHQKQALTFMLQHERPRTYGSEESESDNSSLWRRKRRANGDTVYQEVVSGITFKDEPKQVFGGLLADVMGLGKTLEALSLIAATAQEAVAFSKEKLLRKTPNEDLLLSLTKGTLIICPTSTIKNWEDQIAEHMKPEDTTYYVYHGNRTRNAYELAKYDIVISTYGTIASEFAKGRTTGSVGPVRQLTWFRLILDEAHTIREARTTQAEAMYSIEASRRWALTGTPIQNRIDDLGSLTRFLQLEPYDTSQRFNQYIRGPAQAGDPSFLKALRVFVDSFTLRRLKDRVDLPPRRDLVEVLEFSPEERRLYDFFKDISRGQIQELARAQQQKQSGIQHHVLRGIMTLRLICAHGRDLLKEKDLQKLQGITLADAIDLDDEEKVVPITKRDAYQNLSLMAEAGLDLCRQCDRKIGGEQPDVDDDSKNPRCYVLPCYDVVCNECFSPYRDNFDSHDDSDVVACPFCSKAVASQYVPITGSVAEVLDSAPESPTPPPSDALPTQPEYSGPHTKTLALLRDIAEMKRDSEVFTTKGEPPIKCIVFSEFTSHLTLIERALRDHGHSFVRIDGTMTLNKRKKVLDAFASDDHVTILLASIKAAGQGLNLTTASRAFIMEPMWNPAAEAQAVDRIYRIGQKRDVIVKRLYMKDSIELKIVELQKRKTALADVSMNRNHTALSKQETRAQHMKDILALFR